MSEHSAMMADIGSRARAAAAELAFASSERKAAALQAAVKAGETTYEFGGRKKSVHVEPGRWRELMAAGGVDAGLASAYRSQTAYNQRFIDEKDLTDVTRRVQADVDVAPRLDRAFQRAARQAGARTLVLCDTNGGSLPHEVQRVTAEVVSYLEGTKVGIHTQNDSGCAVANSVAAVLGPSGCGKTHLAHAIANAWQMKLVKPVITPQNSPRGTSAGCAAASFLTRNSRFSAKATPIRPTVNVTTGSGTTVAVAQPVTQVWLTDRRPNHPGVGLFGWSGGATGPWGVGPLIRGSPRGSRHSPWALALPAKWYRTEHLARRALSESCVKWGRRAAGLPPLEARTHV